MRRKQSFRATQKPRESERNALNRDNLVVILLILIFLYMVLQGG